MAARRGRRSRRRATSRIAGPSTPWPRLVPSIDQSAFAARFRGYAGKADIELVGGWRARDVFGGVTTSAAVRDTEVHGEIAIFRTPAVAGSVAFADERTIVKAVAGTSYRFPVGNGLVVFGEYHYSGFGAASPQGILPLLADPGFQVRYLRGDTQILTRHAIAVLATYEYSPELTLAGPVAAESHGWLGDPGALDNLDHERQMVGDLQRVPAVRARTGRAGAEQPVRRITAGTVRADSRLLVRKFSCRKPGGAGLRPFDRAIRRLPRGTAVASVIGGRCQMNIVRWDPFRELDGIQARLNRMFGDRPLRRFEDDDVSFAQWAPAVDIQETDKEFVVKADLPEVKKEDVKVEFDDGVLTVEGERRMEKEETDKKFHRVERGYGKFVRRFALPNDVDGLKVSAEFKEGVLNVHLPKTTNGKGKAIAVKVD